MNVADGWQAVLQAAAQALQPDPLLQIDQWAEEHIVLRPPAAMAGPYRIAHTPMVRRILQCLSPADPHTRVVVRGASQMLKTQAAICATLGWIHRAPANILALEPTDKLAKRLSTRMAEAIVNCDVLADLVAKPRSRDSQNTIDCKQFRGGALYITTAGSAANLAEIPARYVFLDEVDRMASSVDGEGDPIDLAEARTTTFSGVQKVYIASSPTVTDASAIDAQFLRGTQEHYHVPCPHCGDLQELTLDNFRHAADDNGTIVRAWFNCPHCGAEIDEHHKVTMLPDEAMGGRARWVAAGRDDGETVSFHISAFYAPLGSLSWLNIARQLVRARHQKEQFGNVEPLRVFYNTRLALSYAYTSAAASAQDLRDRAEDYPELTVPLGGIVLTAGVDVQHDRLAVVVRAWGPSEESWLVWWGEIYGPTMLVRWRDDGSLDPATSGAWADLDQFLTGTFTHSTGAKLRIRAASIDSGDGQTQDAVYGYVRRRLSRGWIATKGESHNPSKDIFTPPKLSNDTRGAHHKPHPSGVRAYMVGTQIAKDLILGFTDGAGRIKLKGNGAGRMHQYQGVRPDYWDQITAEVKVPHKTIRGRLVWQCQAGRRNEATDCEVLALHAARSLKLQLWRQERWNAEEAVIRQPQLGIEDDRPAVVPGATQQAKPPEHQPEAEPVQTPAPPAATPAAPAAASATVTTRPVGSKGQPGTRRPGGWSAKNW